MDIFKLIYEHDIYFDRNSGKDDTHKEKGVQSSLEEFMKPMPTYVKYYLTGTKANGEFRFGLSGLQNYSSVLDKFTAVFVAKTWMDGMGNPVQDVSARLARAEPNEVFLIGDQTLPTRVPDIQIDGRTGVREKLSGVVPLLDEGIKVLFTEKAHHGVDLHLFSRDNLYEDFFNTFKPLTSREDFRYFSINGKRVGSERAFYFETWTLNRPPHGFEEVTSQAVIR